MSGRTPSPPVGDRAGVRWFPFRNLQSEIRNLTSPAAQAILEPHPGCPIP